MEAPHKAQSELSTSRLAARTLSLVKESDERGPSLTKTADVMTPRPRRVIASAGSTRQKTSKQPATTKAHFFAKLQKRKELLHQEAPPDVRPTTRRPYVASQQGPAPIAPFVKAPLVHDVGSTVDTRGHAAIMNWLDEFPREERDFLSPTNFFDLKASQARRLTESWPAPQRLRIAVAYTALTSLAARHAPIPPRFLAQCLEDLAPAIYANAADFNDAQDAIDENPFLFYYQQATLQHDLVQAKIREVERLHERIAELSDQLGDYQFKQKRSMSHQVVGRFKTSMNLFKTNLVTPQATVSTVAEHRPDERLPTETEICAYFSLMSPEALSSMLHRLFQDPNMPSLTQTLAHLVDELEPDQRQTFYHAYQKGMSADELYNFIANEINQHNQYLRDATMRLTKKTSTALLSEFVLALQKHLLLHDKTVPPLAEGATLTALEAFILVHVESFMARLTALRHDVGETSLVEIIPRHVQIRTDVAKLLEFLITLEGGDPSSLLEGLDDDTFDDGNNGPTGDDDDDDEDEDDLDELKPAKKTRRKAKKRRSTVLSRLKSRTMPLYDVCTTISALVCEKLMQDANDKSLQLQPLKVFTRQYFIRVYGLKSLALSHIASFRTALQVHCKVLFASISTSLNHISMQENPRVGLFYWFLGLDDARAMSAELGFAFFKSLIKHVIFTMTKVKSASMNQIESTPITTLESLMYAWNDLIGDGYSSKDLMSGKEAPTGTFRDKKRMIPVPKALEVCKIAFNEVMEKDSAVLAAIDDVRCAGTPALPMEDFLMQLMDAWAEALERLVVELRLKFKDADKNGDGTMDFEEFFAFLVCAKMLDTTKLEDARRGTQRDGASATAMADMRHTNAVRRKAIAIYDSLANDHNIIDETHFVSYMLTQLLKPTGRKSDDESTKPEMVRSSDEKESASSPPRRQDEGRSSRTSDGRESPPRRSSRAPASEQDDMGEETSDA
ncbi:hypothetical protein SDRG_08074 [Saprolegnia diclina VS20]|uniref:EF-hand domain-containing protein n=1 Tax=Saprolegnia diclina (strain VS20) TaxID=1156394 RepID=T0QHR8_SAPDV|nr:hypothetical protein SDRG_08074 [Saprolegnia diclina VS20]EQC34301.1 hypothetical protein SDRG_08074 [Saprolegnia diclina VS20]|eukprot:XP_008612163.1 hypothetical protein SDRG_08074 [Saprolegnia diclina VS20]